MKWEKVIHVHSLNTLFLLQLCIHNCKISVGQTERKSRTENRRTNLRNHHQPHKMSHCYIILFPTHAGHVSIPDWPLSQTDRCITSVTLSNTGIEMTLIFSTCKPSQADQHHITELPQHHDTTQREKAGFNSLSVIVHHISGFYCVCGGKKVHIPTMIS